MSRAKGSFSLAALFGLLTLAALGCAALANRTSWWASITVTIALLLFGAAILVAVVIARGPRYFSCGFAIAGLSYMLVSFHPWFANFGSSLVTTRVLAYTWTKVDKKSRPERSDYPPFSAIDEVSTSEEDYEIIADQYMTLLFRPLDRGLDEFSREMRSFFFIGQTLFALLLAFLSGLLCSGLYTLRTRGAADRRTTKPQSALFQPPSQPSSSQREFLS